MNYKNELGFLLCIVGLMTVLPAKAQTAVSTDGIIESTAGGFMFPDGSVQTTSADTSDPFQRQLDFEINDGSTQGQIDLNVPVGKRLIIEHASSQVFGPTGQQYRVYIQTTVLTTGSSAGRHYLVLTLQITDMSGLDIYTASQPMRIYADPSSTVPVSFGVLRDSSFGTATARVTISGYLVDL